MGDKISYLFEFIIKLIPGLIHNQVRSLAWAKLHVKLQKKLPGTLSLQSLIL